jgi:hypothetical protein
MPEHPGTLFATGLYHPIRRRTMGKNSKAENGEIGGKNDDNVIERG